MLFLRYVNCCVRKQYAKLCFYFVFKQIRITFVSCIIKPVNGNID